MKKQLLFYCKKTLFREFSFRMTALAVLTLLTAQASFAQSTYTWGTGTSGTTTTSDFLTGSNWGLTTGTGTATPTFTVNNNTFTINSGTTNNPVLSSVFDATNSTCTAINVNTGATLTTNANVITTYTASTTQNLISGVLNITGGTFQAPRLFIGNATSSTGVVNVETGATLIESASGIYRISVDAAPTSPGQLNINGGTFIANTGSTLTVGGSTGRKGIFTLNSGLVQISGTLTLSTTNGSAELFVKGGQLEYNTANFPVNGGIVTISGGSFKLLNTAATINAAQTSSIGTINVSGGTLDTAGSLTIGTTTASATANFTINLNSGTMNVAGAFAIAQNSTGYTGRVIIDAGSIVLTGDQTATINTLVTAGRITSVLGKQVVVNYNGTNTIVSTISAPTWNGSAWTNGTPSSTLDAVIDGTYSTNINGVFTANRLLVNSGKSLTINSGINNNYVTVQNQVVNNGTLVVENNANLIQVNTATNTGNIVVNRNSNALSRLDYTLWSSPVASQNLAAFSPLTSQSPSRFYTYDGTNNVYATVASPTTTSFAAGNGYLIRMPNTAVAYPATETFAGVFTGVPNNGTVNRTGLTAGKFYAVGNPYPSTISAASFLSANSTAGTTLYFWRKTNGVANSGSSYATWTNVGGTAAGNVAPNDIVPNGSIQVGQGFVVNTGTATSLTFTNAMREAAPTSTQFLKIKDVTEKSRIWLNLTSTGLFSQTLVGYLDGATEGVDSGIDGKYINDSPIALTSNIDGEEYTIQGRPAFDASDVVALNFKTDKAGEYKIAIDHTDGVFAKGQAVYLADSVTGKETDLTKEAYTFTAESGTANNRFTLKYQSSSKTVGSPVFNENTVTVYKNNGTLYVNSAASAIVTIKVFNLQGRLIGEQKDVNATIAAIKNLKATQQVLFVQVTSADNKVVTKKVVN